MNDLLAASLAETQARIASGSGAFGGPAVVSEEHNVDNIDVGKFTTGGKPSDGLKAQIDALKGGGPWDAAEYGITREAQVAKLEESYQKALAFEKSPEGIEKAAEEAARVMAEMRRRAIDRAGLDTTGGRVSAAFAKAPAWHKLGVVMSGLMDGDTAHQKSGLAWQTLKKPMRYEGLDGAWLEDKETFSLTRSDTGAKLATVGSRYQPIENKEMFDFLGAVIGQFGAHFESAGAVYGGKKVWACIRLPGQDFAVNGVDEVQAFGIFIDAKGGECAVCVPSNFRAECANTMRQAVEKGRDRLLKIRHTGDLKAKIADARKALGVAVESMGEFKKAAGVMARTPVAPEEYFDGLLDAVIDLTELEKNADFLARSASATQAERDLAQRRYDLAIERKDELLADLMRRYDGEKNQIGGMRGTGWAAFNSVTEAVDHGPLGGNFRDKDKDSKRFESMLTGDGDEVKQLAYERVMAYAN
jgi:phage/plasmid-like protein (TIGR03299 family)